MKYNFPKIILCVLFVLLISTKNNAQTAQEINNKIKLAAAFNKSLDYDKAEEVYLELIELQKWNSIHVENLNRIYIQTKDYEKSIALLQKQLKNNPNLLQFQGLLGTTYYKMSNYNKAYEVWENAIALNKSKDINYRIIANHALSNRAFEKAVEFLRAGKTVSKNKIPFSYEIAQLNLITMNYESGIKEYCDVLNIDENQLSSVKQRISRFLNSVGAIDVFVSTTKNYYEEYQKPIFLRLLNYFYMHKQDYENAFEISKKFEELGKTNGQEILILADEAQFNKQYSFALEAYSYLLENYKSSPFYTSFRIKEIRVLESMLNERYAKANSTWKPVSKNDSLFIDEYKSLISKYNSILSLKISNNHKNDIQIRIADIHFKKFSEYNSALQICEQLFSAILSPVQIDEVLFIKAEILIKTNKLNDAQKILSDYSKSNLKILNNLYRTNYLMGLVNFWQGDFNEAKTNFNFLLNDLSNNFANDALQYSTLIDLGLKDSLNLIEYSKADFMIYKNEFSEASDVFSLLAQSGGFLIKELSAIKFVEILIEKDSYTEATNYLTEIIDNKKSVLNLDKVFYLQGLNYFYGLDNLKNAKDSFNNLLDKFPNSLYLEKSRQMLKNIDLKINGIL